MVLIYYKDKETGKILSFVETVFLTVEKAKEFLNTNNIFTEMDGAVTCIDCWNTLVEESEETE